MTTEFIISLSLNIILFVAVICLTVLFVSIKKRISLFLPTNNKLNVEEMLVEYKKDVLDVLERENKIFDEINKNKQELQNNINEVNIELGNTKNQLKNAIQKVGFIRYNPFDEVGGELCYAVALLDENNNGVVINSIYARETCYSYAKDITNGQSLNHKLSEEEIQAINLAINHNNLK